MEKNHSIRYWLTAAFLWVRGCRSVRQVTLPVSKDEKMDVIVYSLKNDVMAGQRTPFGTITMNEEFVGKGKVTRYILLHERGHDRMPLMPLVTLVVLLTGIMGALSLVPLPILFLLLLLKGQISPTLIQQARFLLFNGIPLILFSSLVNRLCELWAEYSALSVLGEKEFKIARAKTKEIGKAFRKCFFDRIVAFLAYPTRIEITALIWVYKHLK